jgi:hypothetical protein
MKVYRHESRGKRYTLHVKPGATHPVSDWMDADGNAVQLVVRFIDGCADVPDNLGHFLLDQKLATRSILILPAHAQ